MRDGKGSRNADGLRLGVVSLRRHSVPWKLVVSVVRVVSPLPPAVDALEAVEPPVHVLGAFRGVPFLASSERLALQGGTVAGF